MPALQAVGVPVLIALDLAGMHAVDAETLTIGAAVVSLDSTKLATSHGVTVDLERGPVRYTRHTGGTPTATVGIPLYDGGRLALNQSEASNARFIRQGTVNGTGYVTYYRRG